jgi:putative PIN family toxin of toxin-antitoxin system
VRIVLDTNVLVSGLLTPYGAPADVVRMVVSGAVTLCVDARILLEYAEVLARPRFAFPADPVHALLDLVAAEGLQVAAGPLSTRLPDPDDEPFLEVAVAGDAACLVTGNLTHYPPAARAGMAVLAPAEFLRWFRLHRVPSPHSPR